MHAGMIPLYPEFFNDVFGPVMQPGSSSHQAGPCRVGLLAASLLGEPARRVEIHLDPAGSLAGIFGLMKEDRGLAAGVLGMGPEDPRLFDSLEEARRRGVELVFGFVPVPESSHPNAAKIRMEGATRSVTLVGDSVGGGMVEVVSVEGFPVSFQGDTAVVLVFGEGGYRPPEVLESGRVERDGRALHWYKTVDRPADLPEGALFMASILPVPNRPGREPQLFDSMAGWRALAEAEGTGLAEIAMRYEERASAWPRERVIAAMERIRAVLHAQVHGAFGPFGQGPAEPFSRRDDRLWVPRLEAGRSFSGPVLGHALKLALGVNAKIKGVPIVPGIMPIGGSNVFLPAQVGATRALEILLTGDYFPAQKLYEWGFLNRVTTKDKLMDCAMTLAERICCNGPQSIHGIVKCSRQIQGKTLDQQLDIETAIGAPIFMSEDAREGVRAQKEKRKPDYK